jgi:hypothetical protein
VVTNQRFLLFQRKKGYGMAQVGKVLAESPRTQVGARVTTGVLTQVALYERGDDEPLMRLNFGMGRGRARALAAILGDPAQAA